MATPKQIAANRRNAQKSCGAKTKAGKAIVSQNRTIHGLTGTFQVMLCERQADYDDFLDALIADEKPVGLAETQLVMKMAEHNWLSERAIRLQEGCFTMHPTDPAEKANNRQAVAIRCDLLELHIRYHSTHDRAYRRASQEFIQRRKERLKAEIGFESQKRAEADAAYKKELQAETLATAKARRQREEIRTAKALAAILPPDFATNPSYPPLPASFLTPSSQPPTGESTRR